MFIDFHAHFLHGIDDGAYDLITGISMLTESRRQGVEYVLATPHFHHDDTDISRACSVRDAAVDEVENYASEHSLDIPGIITGFEVDFYSGLKSEPDIGKLCIAGTNLLLVEMPYVPWKQNDIEALFELTLVGIKPVIAHIDRYFRHFGDSVFSIFELDAVFQLNCKVMETISGRNFVKKIVKSGRTCVMGTDMHNTDTRCCNIAKAHNSALKKLSPYADRLFYDNAAELLFLDK